MCKEALYTFLTELYKQFQIPMLQRAKKYVYNSLDAEDIVGDCWVDLIRHAERLLRMESSEQYAYIMRCVTNRTIDFLRKRRHVTILPYGIIECPLHAIETSGSQNEEDIVLQRMEVERLLFLLPSREREVISLRLRNHSADEIAYKLKVAPSSVRVYITRASKRLRDYVHSMDGVEET